MGLSDVQHGQSTAQSTTGSHLPPPRQIRFVSTDGAPHAKRRRINAACLTCRKRKTRCSGERPKCRTCTNNGHECSGYAERSNTEADRAEDNDEEEIDPLSTILANDFEALVDAPTPTEVPETELKDAFDGIMSPASNHSSYTSCRNRVPYFRYFGPTAIVPGFKQM